MTGTAKRRRLIVGVCSFAAVVLEAIAFLPGPRTGSLRSFEIAPVVENEPYCNIQSQARCRVGHLSVQLSDVSHSLATDGDSDSDSRTSNEKPLSLSAQLASLWRTTQLVGASLVVATLLIAWEDVSTTHPLRSGLSTEPIFGSTVKGMAFGVDERQRMPLDIEPERSQDIPSYNEVMFRHRTKRVPTWSQSISQEDVERSVRTIQRAVLHIVECERLASSYEWEDLSKNLRNPIITTQLDEACDILNRATEFLPLDVRSEIGFDFGSCAWRHCGAFADVREAVDELDHLVGILEPFEANFVLDVAERGLRDMLAVTTKFQDTSIKVPEYQQLQRKSDLNTDLEFALDVDYLEAMEFIKRMEQ